MSTQTCRISTLALCALLMAGPAFAELPRCESANLGQCVNPDGPSPNGQVCSQTPMGLGWVGTARPCPRADAPLAEGQGRSMLVDPGTIVPFRGVCLDEQEHVRREKINERIVGELEKAHESLLISKPVFIAFIIGAVVLGAGAAAGITYAATR